MPKERKPGWRYFKSEFFNEEFAIHEETGWVYFEKGAKYSPDEIKIIADNGAMMDMATHKVKTVMAGEIVGFEKNKTPEIKKPVAAIPGELEIF